MHSDIDEALRRLGTASHPGLEGLEDSVLAGVKSRREARAGIRMAALAGVGAIALGTLAAGPTAPPASASPLAPFGAAAPLAPSTLLVTE
ncbi:hypothetical protein [Sphingomonas kyeonggiensis]|uniref:Uncharacterized protein n=1 Tax=Sphingomonas kyeonggiensis TaxID=1268553 RepID=A0A7W6JVQ4_9SPHN|nr:hypothetical protein [Sphingomonas kyeonggiensis]MBB4100438.1 hypothetical protein [Sphingomonas kyeonggiensis]